jgi:gp16 family phage-associated protein
MFDSKSTQKIKRTFEMKGVTFREWCSEHRFDPSVVSKVLNGHYRCVRGKRHQIAVALGLKPDPTQSAGDKA